MLSHASQEVLLNTTDELKKVWVGKICIVIEDDFSLRRMSINGTPTTSLYHYIKTATKDPADCDTFGYVDGKLVRPKQKPEKIGEWYFGDKTQHARIDVGDIVLVVDIIRTMGGGRGGLPGWSAIVLYKEKNWCIDLQILAFNMD